MNAKILRWLDGDTCEVLVDLGLTVLVQRHLRVLGIQAPELHGPTHEKGAASKAFAEKIAPPTATAVLSRVGQEKYGRLLAELTVNGWDFAANMIQAGHAVAWDGKGPRPEGQTMRSMLLYEARTDDEQRCYVWAEDASEAEILFYEIHREKTLASLTPLFTSDSLPFCTGFDGLQP
jgi:endonuclease YncB( thermonuclease family)